jgi:hypothetical protein
LDDRDGVNKAMTDIHVGNRLASPFILFLNLISLVIFISPQELNDNNLTRVEIRPELSRVKMIPT